MGTNWNNFQNQDACTCTTDTENYLDNDLTLVKQSLIPALIINVVLGIPVGFIFTISAGVLIVGFTLLYRGISVDYRCSSCRRPSRYRRPQEHTKLQTTKQRFVIASTAMIVVSFLTFMVRAQQLVKPAAKPVVPGQASALDQDSKEKISEHLERAQEQQLQDAARRPRAETPPPSLPVARPTSGEGPDFSMPSPVHTEPGKRAQ